MESIDLLKDEVKKIFGRRILSSADCQNLCEDILSTSSIKISFNTIRRFFSLIKAVSRPSIYTLNTLSNYCGFSDKNSSRIALRYKGWSCLYKDGKDFCNFDVFNQLKLKVTNNL